jgi:hypothetical protein
MSNWSTMTHDIGWGCANHGVSWVCNMSLDLWCAGVELRGDGRRRGEGQVETCHADGPGAVKDGYETWTEGPGGRVTNRNGWHLGTSTSASVHGGQCWPSQDGGRASRAGGSERFGAQAVKDEVTHVEERRMRMEYATRGGFGGFVLKTIEGGFTGLGLKTRAEVPRMKRMARGGIGEVVSRRSYRWGGAVAVGSWVPRIRPWSLRPSSLTKLYQGQN